MFLEALGGIALAGNIIQFLQLASDVVSKAHCIHKSVDNCLPRHTDAGTLAKELQALSSAIRDQVPSLNSIHEQMLRTLCLACDEITKELIEALAELKLDGTKMKWKSTRQALKSVFNQKKLDDILERLHNIRQQLGLSFLVSLGNRMEFSASENMKGFDALEARSKLITKALEENRESIERLFSSQQVRLEQCHVEESSIAMNTHVVILDKIMDLLENTRLEYVRTREEAKKSYQDLERTVRAANHTRDENERKLLQERTKLASELWLRKETTYCDLIKKLEIHAQRNETPIYGVKGSLLGSANKGNPNLQVNPDHNISFSSPTTTTYFSVPDLSCNQCSKEINSAHYHCSTCEEDNFNICETCSINGHCYDLTHWLMRRVIKDGKLLATPYGGLAPKNSSTRAQPMLETHDRRDSNEHQPRRRSDSITSTDYSRTLQNLGFNCSSRKLPRSFVLAAGNKFSWAQIDHFHTSMELASQDPNPLFFSGPEMFPAKILQRIHGKGKIPLTTIAKSMTVGKLSGYDRRVVRGENWPCLIRSTDANAEVYGMLIFGLDASQRKSIDLCKRVKSLTITRVSISLSDGTVIQVKAGIYVFDEGLENPLILESQEIKWDPMQLLDSKYMKSILASTVDEENALEWGNREEQIVLERRVRDFGFTTMYSALPISMLLAISKRVTRLELEQRLQDPTKILPIFFCGPSMFPSGIYSRTSNLPLGTIVDSMTPATLLGYERRAVRAHNWPALYPKGKKRSEVKGMVFFSHSVHHSSLFEFETEALELEESTAFVELDDLTRMPIKVGIHVWKRDIGELRKVEDLWLPSEYMESLQYKQMTRKEGLDEEEKMLGEAGLLKAFEKVENLGDRMKNRHSFGIGEANDGFGYVLSNSSDSQLVTALSRTT